MNSRREWSYTCLNKVQSYHIVCYRYDLSQGYFHIFIGSSCFLLLATFFLSQATSFIFVGPPRGFMQILQFSQFQYWPICSAACYYMQTVLVQIPFSIFVVYFQHLAFPSVWSFVSPLFPLISYPGLFSILPISTPSAWQYIDVSLL